MYNTLTVLGVFLDAVIVAACLFLFFAFIFLIVRESSRYVFALLEQLRGLKHQARLSEAARQKELKKFEPPTVATPSTWEGLTAVLRMSDAAQKPISDTDVTGDTAYLSMRSAGSTLYGGGGDVASASAPPTIVHGGGGRQPEQ